MPLINVILILVAVAVIYWLVQKYVPDNTIKTILMAVIVIGVVLWLLGLFFPSLSTIRVGR